jgi:hypothetical protein
MKDLANDPAQAERKRALFAKLRALQKGLDDTLDLVAVFPDLKE